MTPKLLPLKDQVLRRYAEGATPGQISIELGEYHQAVANLLKYLGVYDSYRPQQGNTRYFQFIDNPRKAYFLGFIAADGCIQNNGGGSLGLTITLHSKDVNILERLRSEIGCDCKILVIKGKMTHDITKEKDHCRFALFNKELFQDLQSHGIMPKKSTTMPNLVPGIPIQFRQAFILGYFDGDGSASYNTASNQMMISFRGTQAFLQGIADELSFSKYRLEKDRNRNCWSLSVWRKQDVLLFYSIYKELDFYLDRKYQRIRSFLKIDKDETISRS